MSEIPPARSLCLILEIAIGDGTRGAQEAARQAAVQWSATTERLPPLYSTTGYGALVPSPQSHQIPKAPLLLPLPVDGLVDGERREDC